MSEPREISRNEPCGCKSYRLDDSKWDGEPFWVMEISCPFHLEMLRKHDEEWDRHVREDHHGVDEDCPPM